MQKPCEVGSAVIPIWQMRRLRPSPQVSTATPWQSQAQAACFPNRDTRHSLTPLEGVGRTFPTEGAGNKRTYPRRYNGSHLWNQGGMSSSCKLFLTPGPLHMLFPGLEYSLHPTHPLLTSFCLTLPVADLCKTYRPELGIKCSAKRFAHSRRSVNKREAWRSSDEAPPTTWK